MTTHVTAIYEGGLLRPTSPLPLQDGAEVEVIVLGPHQTAATSGAADILAAIAALPTDGGDPLTSHDHDRILYSDGETR